MLITISDLKLIWNVNPQSVLHVGAHMAEEGDDYLKHGWGHVTWIEAQPKLASDLKKLLDPSRNLVIEAAIWDQSGVELELKIASNSQSTSLLDFGTHATTYPDITFVEKIRVRTVTLDEVLPINLHPDFLNLDIQGVELQALKGMKSRISKVRWIYTEVNAEDVYKDCTKLPELDAFLQDCGFIRLYTRWSHSKTWGDALYGRTEDYKKLQRIKMKIMQSTKFKFRLFVNKLRKSTKVLFNKLRSQPE